MSGRAARPFARRGWTRSRGVLVGPGFRQPIRGGCPRSPGIGIMHARYWKLLLLYGSGRGFERDGSGDSVSAIAIGSRSVLPILGLSVEVSDCNNKYFRRFDSVDHAVRESTSSTPACILAQALSGVRKTLDTFNRRTNFVPEFPTQSCSLGLVESDRVPKFTTGDFEESHGHSWSNSSKTSSAGTAAI